MSIPTHHHPVVVSPSARSRGARRLPRVVGIIPRRSSRFPQVAEADADPFDLNRDNDDTEMAESGRWSRETSPIPDIPTRHPRYYIEEGNIVFMVSLAGLQLIRFINTVPPVQVENRLLRVHRFFLTRESDFFKTLLSLPQPQGTQEGTSDANPIRLTDTMNITLKQMEALLNYIYQG
jgi:hypothetical protein